MLLKLLIHFSIIITLSGALYAQAPMQKVVDLRIYYLTPGSRDTFHQLVEEKCIPLLEKWNMQVLSYGPSETDENEYHLVRTFKSVEEMECQESAFYSSNDWRNGPREAILSMIEEYSILRIPADSLINYSIKTTTMHELDKTILSKLNAQFIENFINEDVEAQEKIIHPDFVCINNDGTIINREDYLESWATAWTESGYTSFSITDEVIRIFDDMALVRSKTVYTKEVDGKTVHGNSIYVDTYLKEDGEWKCVQAHITPVTAK